MNGEDKLTLAMIDEMAQASGETSKDIQEMVEWMYDNGAIVQGYGVHPTKGLVFKLKRVD